MACFEMSLPRSKRIRSIDAEGHEDFVSDEDLPLLQAAQLAKQAEREQEHSEGGHGQSSLSRRPAPMPLEALEKVQAAQGEVQVILDLIENIVETQHVDIPPFSRSIELEGIVQDWVQRVGGKRHQLQDAAARLRRGADTLSHRIQRDNNFLQEVGALQQAWPVSRAPKGTSGQLRVQLMQSTRLPSASTVEGPAPAAAAASSSLPEGFASNCFVDLLQDGEGHVCMLQEPEQAAGQKGPGRGRVIQGPEAVHAALLAQERALSLRCLEHQLRSEAASSSDPTLPPLLPRILDQVSGDPGNSPAERIPSGGGPSPGVSKDAGAAAAAAAAAPPTAALALGPALQHLAAACNPADDLQLPPGSRIGANKAGQSGLWKGATALSAVGAAPAAGGLLEYAAEWVRHGDLVGGVWDELKQQASRMKGCRIELLPGASQRLPSTAFRIHLPTGDEVLLVIWKDSMRLEGWQPGKRKGVPRWPGDTLHPLTLPQVPSLLEVLNSSLQP